MSSSTEVDEKKSQILQQEYNRYQNLIQELESQSQTIQQQIQEHIIVDHTLTSISPENRKNRKCFKMIGGVLIEKTIDEVLIILNDELKKLQLQRTNIDKELKINKDKLENWIKSKKVKIVKN
ncbi:GIM4 [Candida pseudojiufengensis]|uniref:GIM4 n=1 Tax=Candida pseudojiufengensis TaxID=497109 RepID=UPI002224D1A3|nr:GIM4 [Candida pseudojiufengensis]KAI5964873.1 GIM4 [Candida pseudojiufengensis]